MSRAKLNTSYSYVQRFNIPHGTVTGTGVGTMRRFLISVGAIVMTVGFGGVFSPTEVVDKNVRDRFGKADETDGIVSVSSLSARTEI